MAFRDQDIPALLADTGVPVVIGGVSGIGLLDENDEILVSDRGGAGSARADDNAPGSVERVSERADRYGGHCERDKLHRQRAAQTGDAAMTKILLGSA
jgi:hypothetical protein